MNNMKKVNLLVLGLVVTMGFSSCLKEDSFDESAQFELEKPLVEEYASKNFNNPQAHTELGIWFEVLEQGDPDSYEYKLVENPSSLSGWDIEAPNVVINYTVRLLDNTVVEEDEQIKMSLGGKIVAWQGAFLPKEIDGEQITIGLTTTGLKAGSKIRFVTPSRWAYQNMGSNGIPPNTPLAFDIEVLEIHPPENVAK